MRRHYGKPLDACDDVACEQLRHNAGPEPPVLGSWAALIVWLADEYHDAKLYVMARHLGRAPALLYQWRDGITHRPDIESVDLIARTYGLDRDAVLDIALGCAHRAHPRGSNG